MNPSPSRLLVSFSGGETSALMTHIIFEKMKHAYDEVVVVFANTGQENEETLEFVDRCDRHFGWNVVWIEGETGPRGTGARARVVDFATASRDGRPFEDVIRKYGIPNKNFPHCTRELKERPIAAYVRSLGWKAGTYDLAIGIRIDEIDRMNAKYRERRIIYPLVSPFPHRKADVNLFWARQPFRLRLKGYQGNCKWCWKKSLRKHLTIISETPDAYEFPEKMEALYPLAGPNPKQMVKRFFRGNLTVADLRRMASEEEFTPAEDDAVRYPGDSLAGHDLDMGEGCAESCEIDFVAMIDDIDREAAPRSSALPGT